MSTLPKYIARGGEVAWTGPSGYQERRALRVRGQGRPDAGARDVEPVHRRAIAGARRSHRRQGHDARPRALRVRGQRAAPGVRRQALVPRDVYSEQLFAIVVFGYRRGRTRAWSFSRLTSTPPTRPAGRRSVRSTDTRSSRDAYRIRPAMHGNCRHDVSRARHVSSEHVRTRRQGPELATNLQHLQDRRTRSPSGPTRDEDRRSLVRLPQPSERRELEPGGHRAAPILPQPRFGRHCGRSSVLRALSRAQSAQNRTG